MVAPLDTSEQVGGELKLLRIQQSEADRLELLQRVGFASVICGRPPCLGGDEARHVPFACIGPERSRLVWRSPGEEAKIPR